MDTVATKLENAVKEISRLTKIIDKLTLSPSVFKYVRR
jgi:hypothetical protein